MPNANSTPAIHAPAYSGLRRNIACLEKSTASITSGIAKYIIHIRFSVMWSLPPFASSLGYSACEICPARPTILATTSAAA